MHCNRLNQHNDMEGQNKNIGQMNFASGRPPDYYSSDLKLKCWGADETHCDLQSMQPM